MPFPHCYTLAVTVYSYHVGKEFVVCRLTAGLFNPVAKV